MGRRAKTRSPSPASYSAGKRGNASRNLACLCMTSLSRGAMAPRGFCVSQCLSLSTAHSTASSHTAARVASVPPLPTARITCAVAVSPAGHTVKAKCCAPKARALEHSTDCCCRCPGSARQIAHRLARSRNLALVHRPYRTVRKKVVINSRGDGLGHIAQQTCPPRAAAPQNLHHRAEPGTCVRPYRLQI